MISPEERKLAMVIQIQQLRRELDNLKRQGYRELQLDTYTARRAYAAFMDLVTNLNSNNSYINGNKH